jgi:hypothetical protein
MQGTIIIHRFNKLLTSLQFCLSGKQRGTNLPQVFVFRDLPLRFCELFLCSFRVPLLSSEEAFDDQLKSTPKLFEHVRCSNGCWSSTAFIFEIFTAVLKSRISFKNPCTRCNTATINLFYQLESFSKCFARFETKLLFALSSITKNCQNDLHGTKS